MRKAIIDLGTNTFHLLIADLAGGKLTDVFRERRYVYLTADDGQTIAPAAWARAQEALRYFGEQLTRHGVTERQAFGTAAFRTATNGPKLQALATATLQCPVTTISGDEEARLIAKGVLATLTDKQTPQVIMDIGGGSTEFIIVTDGAVQWRRSFPVGISSLTRSFHRSDPISPAELTAMEAHLDAVLSALPPVLAAYDVQRLIGAAGTFEVLGDHFPHPTSLGLRHAHAIAIPPLLTFADAVIKSDAAQRYADGRIPDQRVPMMVAAMVFVRYVLQRHGITELIVSDYSLKEGALL